MENPQLTIADLASLHSILDAACTRGAFKASEMTKVGEIYDRLSRFLEASKQQIQEQTPQAELPQGGDNA